MWGDEGNDTITGGEGSDTIDGGTGVDVVVYNAKKSDYVISSTEPGVFKVDSKQWGIDTVRNVEVIQFADGRVDLSSGVPIVVNNALFDSTVTQGYNTKWSHGPEGTLFADATAIWAMDISHKK